MSTNPFGESDLAPFDLSTDLWCDGQERPRKRIRAHLPSGHLVDLASKHDRAFNALVARAHFEAEVTRASTLHAAVDESRALAGYDPIQLDGRNAAGHLLSMECSNTKRM